MELDIFSEDHLVPIASNYPPIKQTSIVYFVLLALCFDLKIVIKYRCFVRGVGRFVGTGSFQVFNGTFNGFGALNITSGTFSGVLLTNSCCLQSPEQTCKDSFEP